MIRAFRELTAGIMIGLGYALMTRPAPCKACTRARYGARCFRHGRRAA